MAAESEPGFVFQDPFDTCFYSLLSWVAEPIWILPDVGLLLRGAAVAVAGEKLMYRVPWCPWPGRSSCTGCPASGAGRRRFGARRFGISDMTNMLASMAVCVLAEQVAGKSAVGDGVGRSTGMADFSLSKPLFSNVLCRLLC